MTGCVTTTKAAVAMLMVAAGLAGAAEPVSVRVTVSDEPTGIHVGPYPASANCHGIRRHLLDDPRWDTAMEGLFGGNLLMLLERPLKAPDAEGWWWDIASIDAFIRRAKTRWQVKELAFLPQLRVLDWDGKSAPTDAQFSRSADVFRQLVERYGPPGPLHVGLWMCNDEWPCSGFWYEHPEVFASRYAELVALAKGVNPELRVGGPVNCWPNRKVQELLLKACPELDFIAWNLFTTLNGEMPIDKVLERTSSLGANVSASRRLSREVLGRELPVMVSSYHLNGHAWDPPDYRLAQPIGAVWNAYALASMLREGVYSAVLYNVLALDCGLFGPNDGFAVKGGMLDAEQAGAHFNVRPLAYVHHFVAEHFPNAALREVTIDPPLKRLQVTAAAGAGGRLVLLLVNGTDQILDLDLEVPAGDVSVSGREPFVLPTTMLYSDQHRVEQGRALFFDSAGTARVTMPPLSAWGWAH